MTKYVLIADSFQGNVSYFFDSKGYLVEFQLNSWNVQEPEHGGVLKSLGYCLHIKDFLQWITSRYKFRKQEVDLSFDRMYNFYGIMRDRFKAEPIWAKLNERDRYYTLLNIRAYKAYCSRNPLYTQMYLHTYLKSHRQDDWDKVPDYKKFATAENVKRNQEDYFDKPKHVKGA